MKRLKWCRHIRRQNWMKGMFWTYESDTELIDVEIDGWKFCPICATPRPVSSEGPQKGKGA